MAKLSVSVSLSAKTGLPRDQCVNTFAFVTAFDPTEQDLDDIRDALETFYNGPGGSGFDNIKTFISPAISRSTPVLVEFWTIAVDNSLTPIGDRVFTLGAGQQGEISLPLEVAAVVSFGTLTGGVLKTPTERGRVYIGPLQVAALASVEDAPIMLPGFVTVLAEAGRLLMNDINTQWSVWSRKTNILTEVTGGYVNNEFDTQRRRQHPETSRRMFDQ